jgi:hypothetical protein
MTEKGRTATVDSQTVRGQTRWSLNGQEQSIVAASQFARKRPFQVTTCQLIEAFDPSQLASMPED